MASRITIFSLVKAFRVLELVSSSTSGYTLTELVRHLKISMGAAQRITNTLLDLGYLYKEPKTKIFRLTPKFLSFGSPFLSQSEIRDISLKFMRQLNEELNEVVNLGVMMNDEEIVYIDRVDSSTHIVSANIRAGSRRPIHLNSIGKVILAHLPETDQKRILDNISFEKYPSKTLRNRRELEDQLRTIRRQGYSAGKSELYDDIYAIAVPILNHHGVAVAGLNVVIPLSRASKSEIQNRYIPRLLEAGRAASEAFGSVTSKRPTKRQVVRRRKRG